MCIFVMPMSSNIVFFSWKLMCIFIMLADVFQYGDVNSPLSRRWWYCYTVLLVINTAVEVVAWPCVITGMLSGVPLLLMFTLGIWNLKQDTNQVSWFETALINWCFSSLFAHTIFFTHISLVYLSGFWLHQLAIKFSSAYSIA